MAQRLIFFLRYWLSVLLLFVIEKPLSMLYTMPSEADYRLSDFLSVMLHALPLDISCTGYVTIFPLLLLLLSVWWKRMPFREIVLLYNIPLALILALLFVGDTILYPFWGYKLDCSVIAYLATPHEAMASVSALFVIVAVAVIILLSFLIFFLLKSSLLNFTLHKRRLLTTSLLLVVAVFLLLTIRGGVKESTMNVGRVYYSTDQYLNHSAVNPMFSFMDSLGRRANNYAERYRYHSEQKRAMLMEQLYPSSGESEESVVPLLKTTTPNLLILIMEGFGCDFISSMGGVEGVAPNLEQAASEGILFENCYAGSFRTDRGVVCLLNGHHGLPMESIMKLPRKSSALPSIAKKLVEKGYNSTFMYGGDINFTNMKSYLWSGGYQHIIADTDFTVSQRRGNAWGVNDEYMLEKLISVAESRPEPWHIAALTLSSHEPFEVPANLLEEKIPNSFAYTDSCIGLFLDSLRSMPLWDNLLVVLVPDHGFCYPQQGSRHAPHVHHIPLIWTGGAIKEPQRVSRLMNQADIAATLFSQMGIDYSDFRFSRDIFSHRGRDFAFYSFINGFCMIDSTGVTIYDENAHKVVFSQDVDSETMSQSSNADRIELGKALLQTLYEDLDCR